MFVNGLKSAGRQSTGWLESLPSTRDQRFFMDDKKHKSGSNQRLIDSNDNDNAIKNCYQ